MSKNLRITEHEFHSLIHALINRKTDIVKILGFYKDSKTNAEYLNNELTDCNNILTKLWNMEETK